MSLETVLTPLLLTVCDEVSPDFADFETPRPYVTYQRIGGQVIVPLDSTLPGKLNAEVQINVWADTRLAASDLMLAIQSLLIQSTTVTARPLAAPVSDFDSDIPVYGSRQDFTIWYDA
jgi:hypothetical protein